VTDLGHFTVHKQQIHNYTNSAPYVNRTSGTCESKNAILWS